MASASSVVLVTGVSRPLGARIAARLSDDPRVERIIGVDTRPALPGLGRTEFVRADPGHRLIGAVLDQAGVDTLVAADAVEAVRASITMVIGCARSQALRRLVAVSSVDGYGAGRRDPAVFTERTAPSGDLRIGALRRIAAVEAALRSFARQRPDVQTRVLRLAPLVGPQADSWLVRYLDRPFVPSALGFDPRLQVLHEFDAVEAAVAAARSPAPVTGPINVAGAGVVSLAQAVRIAGRIRVPVPAPLLELTALAPRGAGALLRFGRCVDTAKLTDELGYQPRYSTLEALYAHAGTRAGATLRLPGLAAAVLAGAARITGS